MGLNAWLAWGLCGILWGCLLGHAVWRWWRMPEGMLTWHPVSPNDASMAVHAAPTGWWWSSAAYPEPVGLQDVQVTFRLNRVVMLRWRLVTGSRVVWVCVQRRQEGIWAWHALQRALTAHAG